MTDEQARAFVDRVASLYLSEELSDDEPVEPVEVLDLLITDARKLSPERPSDFEDQSGSR